MVLHLREEIGGGLEHWLSGLGQARSLISAWVCPTPNTDTLDSDTTNPGIYSYTVLVGAGAGCYIVADFTIVQPLIPAEETANATGAMAVAQDLGMVLFLAISGTGLQNTAVEKLRVILPNTPAAEIIQLVAGASSIAYQTEPIRGGKTGPSLSLVASFPLAMIRLKAQ
ncbi:hypothetical protein B0H67DRAFT_121133 [Lasiosphaeris hirsuta]|uniref:Uncharacterized protein n=1 Tax=Lasiosphaeris hirsuta TaxID=260670 RepID=A0AA40AZX6_9PEZI|nr:hypothetical protein B0H67DRAFT_121133 [Lasiosphaeris hirsuta]